MKRPTGRDHRRLDHLHHHPGRPARVRRLAPALAVLAAMLLLPLVGCGTSSSSSRRMDPQEQLEVKRTLLLEHGAELTAEQRYYVRNLPFESRAQAEELVERFLAANEQRADNQRAISEDGTSARRAVIEN